MSKRAVRFLIAILIGLACVGARPALADCKIGLAAELPLDPSRNLPIAEGEINGQPARFLIDTGASWTMIVRGEALKRHLAMGRLKGVAVYGVGGETEAFGGMIRSLKVGGLEATNAQVIASTPPKGLDDVAVILGEDVMSDFDIEFDLANHRVRFFKPQGCSPDQLVYWNKPYSQSTLLETDRDSPSIRLPVLLNGRKVAAVLSSGSSVSFVDKIAADAVGAKLDTSALPETLHGVGELPQPLTTGRFSSFALGDESVGNVRIWVADFAGRIQQSDDNMSFQHNVGKDEPRSMLVGADFLRAHRVMVANREHVMVFSYNGGPIFGLPTSADLTSGAGQVGDMTGRLR